MIPGVVASQSFFGSPPPPETDPFWANVVLSLPFDGTNGSTTVTDVSTSAKPMTSGGATITTSDSAFGGGSSLNFSGTSQHVRTTSASTDFDFGSSDFTVESWVKLVSGAPPYRPIVGHDNIGVSRGWLFLVDGDVAGKLVFAAFSNNTTSLSAVSAAAFPLNVWRHVAACRSGNSLRLFVHGNLEATTDVTGFTIQNPNQPLSIGTLWLNGAAHTDTSNRWSGRMDSMRITRAARYTASFTPPSAPFPTS